MAELNNVLNMIEVGIRAENLKQKAIANNVANLETPGYRRMDVEFKELLAKALESGGEVDLSKVDPKLYQPENTPVKSNGNDVSFEQEVGDMVKNTLRHKTFVRLLQKKYAQMELAMNVK